MYKDCKGRWQADLGNGNYKNPILFADYSDPDVIRVDDDFFMISSSFTYFPAVPVLHSKDLVNWRVVSYAVNSLPFKDYDIPQHGKGVWAPSIRYHNGTFYVVFGAPDEGIFMSKTKDPFGKWDDVVCMKEAKGWIDPCPFWDDDGNAYLVHAFAKSRCGFKSLLHINKISRDCTKILDEGVLVVDGTVEQPTVEGPKLYKRNGYYYIFAPAGGVRVGWQMVARAENIYGPYECRIVMEQGNTPINGPHQGGYIELENGEGWFIHFQDINAYGRVTHLQPVKWVDDWPVIGIDDDGDMKGNPVLEYKKPSLPVCEPCMPDIDDDFKDGLGIQWQFQAHKKDEYYSIEEKGLKLPCLGVKSEGKPLFDAPQLLSQLMQSPNFEAETKILLKLEKDGDCAGITITGGNYYCIRAVKKADGLYIEQANYEFDKEQETSESVADSKKIDDINEIYMKTVVTYNGNIDFYYSLDGNNYEKLGETVVYNVSRKSWVGGRTGIFALNSENENGGYAVFEYVHFK